MKISIDGKVVLEITPTDIKVLKHVIPASKLLEEIERRLLWAYGEKYDHTFKLLKDEWEPKLIARGVQALPIDKDAYAELIFSQPDYKDRDAKEAEEAQARVEAEASNDITTKE